MKAIQRRTKTVRPAGLILLLTEKTTHRAQNAGESDEREQTGILTPGLSSFPPSRSLNGQWHDGTRILLQWRNRPRISRGSQTSACVILRHRCRSFKELTRTVSNRAAASISLRASHRRLSPSRLAGTNSV